MPAPKKTNLLRESTDEQICIEWHRRHKGGIIAFQSTDKLNPQYQVTLGKDIKVVHSLARGILQMAESAYEQQLECETIELNKVSEALDNSWDEDDDDDEISSQ